MILCWLSQQESPQIIFLCFSHFLLVLSNYILWWLVAYFSTIVVFAVVANMWKNVVTAKINCFFSTPIEPYNWIHFNNLVCSMSLHGIFYFEELLHGSMLLNFLSKAHERGRQALWCLNHTQIAWPLKPVLEDHFNILT